MILMTPKSLLRHPRVRSTVDDLVHGKFQETIDDPAVEVKHADKIERVLLCSGKIYLELLERKEQGGYDNIAIVRIEQFYPTPKLQDKALFEKYSTAKDWYWVQEEPQNMGAFNFLRPLLGKLVGRHVRYIGREPAATPATGFHNIYLKEREELLTQAVGPLHQGEFETA